VDLANQTLSLWVHVPGSLYGPVHNPNGIRIFVKDSQWHSEYGSWTHLVPGRWTRLTLAPSTSTPAFGYRDADFNPHQIILIGVSIATGRDSPTHSSGEMLVDDVRWGAGTAPKYGFE